MAYLNLDLDYFDHPKTKRLIGLLGRGSDVLPVRLWAYCGKYHADTGHLIGYSPTELETVIGWWGQPGRAVEALLRPFQERPGFLERLAEGFKVHDWEKVNGHIAAFKARAQAGAAEKWRRFKAEADAQALLKQSLSNAASNALTTPTLPKEIKKIENTLNQIGVNGLMPAKAAPPTIHETRRRLAKAARIDLLADPAVAFFDEARKSYPGTKNGLITEWGNFSTKYRDEIETILPLLSLAIQREMEHKAALKAAGLMVPQWKNFPTWINNRCWEQEFGKVENDGKNGSSGGNRKESRAERLDQDARDILREYRGSEGGNSAPVEPHVSLSQPGTAGA